MLRFTIFPNRRCKPARFHQNHIRCSGGVINFCRPCVAGEYAGWNGIISAELRCSCKCKFIRNSTFYANSICGFHLIIVFHCYIWGFAKGICAPYRYVLFVIVRNQIFPAKAFVNITDISGMRLCTCKSSCRIMCSIGSDLMIDIYPFRNGWV